jgi:CheY-like chemotaxis protein
MQRQASSRPVVLIVEDEALLRWQAAEIVEDAGFDVVEAATADEAITVLETRNDIRLVFTDIQMPGSIDGLRLAHLVKTRWPPVQIIATSGRLRLRDDDLPKGGRYLPKPYAVTELTQTLEELIAV